MADNWLDEMIDLEVTPKPLRTETVREFCERHKVAERTYYYQACKKENQEKIIELSLSLAKQSVPEVLQVLADKAKSGDMKAIDTYLDSVVKLAKNFEVAVTLSDITDEQADKILQRRIESLSKGGSE